MVLETKIWGVGVCVAIGVSFLLALSAREKQDVFILIHVYTENYEYSYI